MSHSEPCLLIRAEGGPGIGAGHVMRCLALAQEAISRGGRVLYDTGLSPDSGLGRRLLAEGVAIEPGVPPQNLDLDARSVVDKAHRIGADAVVVDGYRFDADYQRQIHQAGLALLWIDDEAHAAPYTADVVLNQNPHASAELYQPRADHTHLLLGPHHALLRREMLRQGQVERSLGRPVRNLLVTLGGGDADNATARVLEGLALALGGRGEVPEVRVVVGGFNPHLAAIRQQADSLGFRVLHAVDDMAPLLAEADLAITAAGSTCWELAYFGLPALVVTLAENQRPIAQGVAQRGMAVDLGWHHALEPERLAAAVEALLGDAEKRRHMSERGQTWVDGHGARRVLDAVLSRRTSPRP